jgi:hypothetical protein
MREQNVDFEIPVTREQWEQIGRTAARLGPEEGGYRWSDENPERIDVLLRDEEARGLWSNFVSDEEDYGDSEREVAHIVFNDGRPYARLEAQPSADEPAVNSVEEQAMVVGLERWLHDRWQGLMKESGLHYERGHIPQS